MGFPSLIQELLIPGLIALFAAAIAAIEFGLVSTDEVDAWSPLATTIGLTGALVAAYLVGIAIRHFGWRLVPSLVPGSATLYHTRLADSWATSFGILIEYWLPERDPTAGKTDDDAYQLITRISYYYLGQLGDGWASRVSYHRSIARVAGNSLASLSLLTLACIAAVFPNAIESEQKAAVAYLVGAVLSAGLALLLRETFRTRMYWYVDALVMTDLGIRRPGRELK